MNDRARTAAWRTGLRDEDPAAPAPILSGSAELSPAQIFAAQAADPVVWRALVRSGFLLAAPGSWRSDEDVVARIRGTPVPDQPSGPPRSRAQILDEVFTQA